MNLKLISLAAISFMFAAPAFAHHSFAMFDQEKTFTYKGVVKELEWNNPHVWLRVTVKDPASGKDLPYAFEMGSVRRSMLDGWKADSVKPGDQIAVTIHPLKDGSRGGMYLAAELPSGKKFGRTGPAVGLPDPN
jgi:hypothetical protein